MELVQKYLDDVQKIKGIYVLSCSSNTIDEEVQYFMDQWKDMMPNENLIVLPDDMKIEYVGEEELKKGGFFVDGTGS